MPIPRRVARLNRLVTNRLIGPLAALLPGFGVVHHRGRRSGRRYRTPVNVFFDRGEAVIALTYGPGSDWVRNLLAAGEGRLRHRGRLLPLMRPRLAGREQMARLPAWVRPPLRRLSVSWFLVAEVTRTPREG